MQRRYNLAHFILAGVVVLGLTSLIVDVDAQARIAFSSERDGNWEIYVMDADGGNPQKLTNNPHDDTDPAWFDPAFAVAPAPVTGYSWTGKMLTMWGWLKQGDR